MSLHPDWLVPDWPAPGGVQAVFTTRAGGVSVAPFDALNLGQHVGDAADQVAHNRNVLGQALGHAPVFMNQVHGTALFQLTGAAPKHPPVADAAWTQLPGLVCTVMVADCLPVLLCSADGTWVAAAHAGWRGLAGTGGQGVLESVLSAFKALQPMYSAGAAPDLIAWLGPCIGPQAFEVGPEVRAAFLADSPAVHSAAFAPKAPQRALEACFTPGAPGKYLADLPQLARLRLAALGVRRVYGNDGTPPWCTVASTSRFFSYRRDGATGRMAACIWRG